MSKKNTRDSLRELKELAEKAGLGGAGKEIPWSEQKARARECAKKGRFDVERILLNGTLEAQIAYQAKYFADDLREDLRAYPGQQQVPTANAVLKLVATYLADKLALRFRDGDSLDVSSDAIELALSFLYLFPKL